MNTLTIDKTTFRFRSRRGLEDLTVELIEVVRKYQDAVLACLIRMKQESVIDSAPQHFDVVLRHRIRKEDGKTKVAGRFNPLDQVMLLNAEAFTYLKQNCVDIENAHYEMMRVFLHELAHWITFDEDEAEELASEWMTAG